MGVGCVVIRMAMHFLCAFEQIKLLAFGRRKLLLVSLTLFGETLRDRVRQAYLDQSLGIVQTLAGTDVNRPSRMTLA